MDTITGVVAIGRGAPIKLVAIHWQRHIGGIAYIQGQPVLFSRMTDELRPFKKFIVRCALRAARMAAEAHAAAVANPKEPLSCRLLARLGLTWRGTSDEGEVFVWAQR